jgi:hypothetical protein
MAPSKARPWPNQAAQLRDETEELATEIEELTQEARKHTRSNPLLVERILADIRVDAILIRERMRDAKRLGE